MATGKSCSRWFAAMAALLMVVSLSGCFDKEGDQRKAFIDFLQNTAMRSGERLPTLTADQKKQFGPFVSDYAVIYGYSQQVSRGDGRWSAPGGGQRQCDPRPAGLYDPA